MVFRILCGEWIEPLWDCMRVINPFGCNMFFLGTLVLGNFMVSDSNEHSALDLSKYVKSPSGVSYL